MSLALRLIRSICAFSAAFGSHLPQCRASGPGDEKCEIAQPEQLPSLIQESRAHWRQKPPLSGTHDEEINEEREPSATDRLALPVALFQVGQNKSHDAADISEDNRTGDASAGGRANSTSLGSSTLAKVAHRSASLKQQASVFFQAAMDLCRKGDTLGALLPFLAIAGLAIVGLVLWVLLSTDNVGADDLAEKQDFKQHSLPAQFGGAHAHPQQAVRHTPWAERSAGSLLPSRPSISEPGSQKSEVAAISRPSPLCNELLVPAATECTLVIPKEASEHWGAGQSGGFYIVDTVGKPVLCFSVKAADVSFPPSGGARQLLPRLALTASPDGMEIAYCVARPGSMCFEVFRHTGELYATVDSDSTLKSEGLSGYASGLATSESDTSHLYSFVVKETSRDGRRTYVHFPAGRKGSHIRIAEDNDQTHALVEPVAGESQGGARSNDCGLLVRISPGGDVALVLCGLLCSMQLLRLKQKLAKSGPIPGSPMPQSRTSLNNDT